MVSPADGKAICFACVGRAERSWGNGQQREVPPPAPAVDSAEERKRYLKELGLKDPTDEREIKAAFRKLSARHHPDKARTESSRRKAEAKYKRITEAYSWLMQNHQRAA
jgi:DnaJ-domain-containing protein 1